jgi:hypothetical protein
VIVLFFVALWLVAHFPNNSKEEQVGTALLSGVVVGAVLLIVERSFTTAADRRQTDRAMETIAAPVQRDEGAPPAPVKDEENALQEALAGGEKVERPYLLYEVDTRETRSYRVVFEDTQRDTSRVDAIQIRLRVFVGDGYFQFVTIPVPTPELRRLVSSDRSVTRERLWWHIAKAAESQLTEAIGSKAIPLSDPTFAFEVQVFNLDRAVLAARLDLQKHEVRAGETIYEFVVA